MLKKFYHPKLYIVLVVIALALTGAYFWLCRMAGDKALEIFNREMARQHLLEGSVAVESISADMWGNVGFRGLKWLDADGEPVVFVPDGRFKVKPWDVVTGSVKLGSLQEAELNNPVIAIRFNKEMRPSFLPKAEKKQDGAAEPRKRGLHINLPDNLPQSSIKINNCTLTASYQHRYFVLSGVNIAARSEKANELKLKITANNLGGMMIGDEIGISGKVLLNGGEPQCDLYLSLKNVVPESLGLGKVKDTASVYGHATGPLAGPVIDGRIEFAELNIPALRFYKVNGDFLYKDGHIDFSNVTGGIYGGTVEATGTYDIDSRAYTIDALGHDLMASVAAKTSKINCRVELDLKMRCDGNPHNVLTYGSFTGGAGTYSLIPFESISGSISDQNGVLQFTDVKIKTPLGEVTSDAFEIVKGRVHIKDIFLTAPQGQRIQIK